MAADPGTPASSPPRTDASTRLLCVLGHPVGHSLSPALHSAAIAATGLNAVYLAFDVAPDDLPAALAGLRALRFLGGNVTIPHKQAVLALVDDATAEATAIGAANTLFWEGDRLVADNTDAAGLRGVLVEDCGVGEGDRILIVGSGGAARAVAVACGRLGARVDVHARRPAAAQSISRLAQEVGGLPPRPPAPPRVIVNATPLGRQGEPLPDAYMGLGEGRVALDLNYGTPSPFLRSATAAGGTAVDGLGMLLGQAEAAWARWIGEPPPAGVMARGLPSATGPT